MNWDNEEEIIYPCPCGRSTYTEYIDRTPGFREHDAHFQCRECENKYNLVKNRYGRFVPELKDEED